MQYRTDSSGNKISQLGFGCMRFAKKGASINLDQAEAQIMAAIEAGVNYFDTAFIYPGSEDALGKILVKNDMREKVYIADKLPHYLLKSLDGVQKTFDEQRARLGTRYIDYYLMHMLNELSEWERLCAWGIREWIAQRKAEGSIGQIGFSFHGSQKEFMQLIDAYDWDFCQIQYNYLDENSQAGRKGLTAAAEKGISVIVMEPLRGGKLVNLPAGAQKIVAQSRRNYSAAEWGLRWLWDQPEVTCVLSGMNTLQMVIENTRIASEAQENTFTEEDRKTIEGIKAAIRDKERIGCTECAYCMPCPRGVDIPELFHHYNLLALESKSSARFDYVRNVGLRQKPAFASQCIGCGLCEMRCPQHLPIRRSLDEADAVLRPLPYKWGLALARKVLRKEA